MSGLRGARIHVTGVVQGVGFRPFVYSLAIRHALEGWVRNTSSGVDIEVDGDGLALETFLRELRLLAPPLARIDEIQAEECAPNGHSGFEIKDSETIPTAYQPISPDVGLCPDCLHELFDPSDRRFRYPFINCTNCGPRFSIIADIPYDRANTTMARFAMCPECADEFADTLDRRFHAQPVACPACGPHVWLERQGDKLSERDEAITAARDLLRNGDILAVKGLGGFHLACDATNPSAVGELRRRKLRVDKPFAVMMADRPAVEARCLLDEAEISLLESRERPIVILRGRPGSDVVAEVAPGQGTIGVMLPYTPVHYLLLEPRTGFPDALVMTSGNLSEEPIATDNNQARQRLASLADAFLLHDRDIYTRCDDSVVRVASAPRRMAQRSETQDSHSIVPLRRSRGYAPFPVYLPSRAPSLLAVGAELKNAFCLTRDRHAFMSQHIGDMENYETLRSFEESVRHFERLFRIRPEAIAYDLHPDYLATRYALERADREGLPGFAVQHHHAHIAACMVENGLSGDRPVLGVAFDGTGYGDDGRLWGGEFLLSDFGGYQRAFHLDEVALLGGEAAVREPFRVALAWLERAGVGWDEDLPPVRAAGEKMRGALRRMLDLGGPTGSAELNCPLTSSMGRLFDAVASLAGVRHVVNYEGQAAIELEARVDHEVTDAYPFALGEGVVDPSPMIRAVVADLRAGASVSGIAARFHNAVAQLVRDVCHVARERFGVSEVALSGGVWQNMTLLAKSMALLDEEGCTVYTHSLVPPNDGGLALGQAAVAAQALMGSGPRGLGG
jgi:hydrogenase maturation protein HypF